jgi:prepilin-type processing-associated H-X9-DG protein/prepilin-type N-terminal cleavage/methylation domain-containing protein
MMNKASQNVREAFTLIELLAAIAIIGVLVALSLSAAHTAREEARRILCASNLRQMALAALTYESQYGEFPPAYARDFTTGTTQSWESYLWDMGTRYRVHQCPSFHGEAMWDGDDYTGYNYNASYVGGRILRRDGRTLPGSTRSADLGMIADPSQCALFGDAEYASGANKFMRSPFPGRLDSDASLAKAGTQGFRHRGRTNVAFADGHVESRHDRHTTTAASGKLPGGCGFLSPDNSLYDLE